MRISPTKAIPFFLLGAAAIAGVFATVAAVPDAPKTPPPPPPAPLEVGSVKITTEMERSHLPALAHGETYARVVLEGRDLDVNAQRIPISLTILMDKSGSMKGDKIRYAKKAAQAAMLALKPGDKVSVLAFSSRTQTLVDAASVGMGNMNYLAGLIDPIVARGGTDMIDGLAHANNAAAKIAGPGRVQRVLLLSDGHPDSHRGLDTAISTLAQKGVLTTTLGMGKNYNEELMTELATLGRGNYYYIRSANQAVSIFQNELDELGRVVGQDAVVRLRAKNGAAIRQVYGFVASPAGSDQIVNVGDIYAQKRADILVRLAHPSSTEGALELLDVDVSYRDVPHKKVRDSDHRLSAFFTTNAAQVEGSLHAGVAVKAEKVKTAIALREATRAYRSGNKDKARRIMSKRKKAVRKVASMAPAKKAAPKLDSLYDDMDEFESEAERGDFEDAAKGASDMAMDMLQE